MNDFGRYRNLLQHLKDTNHEFVSFADINSSQPPKGTPSVALRYDIHLRDINNAMQLVGVEKDILGRVCSTSFVMFGLSGSTMLESLAELIYTREYDEFVEFMLSLEANVEPHISPINDYIRRFQPNWMTLTEEEISRILIENYECHLSDQGVEFVVVNQDQLNLVHINKQLLSFIEEYSWNWQARYGVKPRGYAVHGNGLPLNRLLHNGVLMNQLFVRKSYPDLFEVHSSDCRKALSLYSDCTIPYWMWKEPAFKQKNLQLLIHPAQWEDQTIDKKVKHATREQIEKGHLLYPYATPLDTIINPIDFIKSGLGRYAYSESKKSCYYE